MVDFQWGKLLRTQRTNRQHRFAAIPADETQHQFFIAYRQQFRLTERRGSEE
jgi:hypothetical protein